MKVSSSIFRDGAAAASYAVVIRYTGTILNYLWRKRVGIRRWGLYREGLTNRFASSLAVIVSSARPSITEDRRLQLLQGPETSKSACQLAKLVEPTILQQTERPQTSAAIVATYSRGRTSRRIVQLSVPRINSGCRSNGSTMTARLAQWHRERYHEPTIRRL